MIPLRRSPPSTLRSAEGLPGMVVTRRLLIGAALTASMVLFTAAHAEASTHPPATLDLAEDRAGQEAAAAAQDQPTDTIPTDRPVPDEALELQRSIQTLLAIFRRIDGLREVRITVEDGILELSGTALAQEDRLLAGTLAEDVPGIIWVDNRITVETALSKRLAPALERLAEKGDRALRFIPSFILGVLLIGGAFFLAYLSGRWFFTPKKGDRNPFARNLARQGLRGAIGLAGILLALELMAATALVGAVIGAAGVMGIAVGFAFRDIIENYLAGVLLSLRQPFFHNDHVELEGHEGRIVRLTGRETILMTLDGNHVRIPNATVFKSVMTNFTRNPRRRFVVKVGVSPTESLARAIDAGTEVLEGLAGILERPGVSARVHDLGDSTVELRFSGWVDQTSADFNKVRSEAMKALKEHFESLGIETPPPEYGVRLLGSAPREVEAPVGTVEPPSAPSYGPRAPLPGSDPDISPDKTIEEEIEKEIRASDEEDLLQPPPARGR